MPQVRGAGTWLSNTRQETRGRDKRPRIDHSGPYIQNKRYQRVLLLDLELLQAREKKAIKELNRDIGAVCETARKFDLLKQAAEVSKIDNIFKNNTSNVEQLKKPRSTGEIRYYFDCYKQCLLKEPLYQEQDTLLPQQDSQCGRLAEYLTNQEPTKINAENTPPVPMKVNENNSPVTQAYIASRRTSSSLLPNSLSSSEKLQDFTNFIPRIPMCRPRTTNHMNQVNTSTTVIETVKQLRKLRKRPKTSDPSYSGRSFLELKELTNIDHVCKAEKAVRRTEVRRIRDRQLEDNHRVLTKRIGSFIYDLEALRLLPCKRKGYTIIV